MALLVALAISFLLHHYRYNALSSCMPYIDLKILLKERPGTMCVKSKRCNVNGPLLSVHSNLMYL